MTDRAAPAEAVGPAVDAGSTSESTSAAPSPADREGSRKAVATPWYFRYRSRLIIALAVILVIWPFWRMPLEPISGATGMALVLAGLSLRLWCIRQLGGAARKTSSAKGVQLVDWGPFSLSRNPIYVANMTLFAGFAVLAGMAWALPVLLGLIVAQYHFTVRYEEGFLRDRFGEAYEDYCRSTPRWLGAFRYRPAPAGFAPYPVRKLIKRERSLIFLQVLGGLVLVLVLRLVLPWLL